MNFNDMTNRELMSLRRETIEDMNYRSGWEDRSLLDQITAEIARRQQDGRMHA